MCVCGSAKRKSGLYAKDQCLVFKQHAAELSFSNLESLSEYFAVLVSTTFLLYHVYTELEIGL